MLPSGMYLLTVSVFTEHMHLHTLLLVNVCACIFLTKYMQQESI